MNIKSFLREMLMDPEIISLTADKTVYFLHAVSPTPPYIEYEIFDENGAAWAENKEIASTYYVQVDIFSKSDYSALEDAIKQKLLEAGFIRTSAADLYEEDTQLYHKAMRFVYTAEN